MNEGSDIGAANGENVDAAPIHRYIMRQILSEIEPDENNRYE